MSKIIAFHGPAASGKTTCCQMLKARGYQEYNFADPLKHICKVLFNLTDQQLYNQDAKESFDERLGTTPRRILQAVGTELFRIRLPEVLPELKYSSIWINLAKEKFQRDEGFYVIGDCRFPDEIKAVQDAGGIVIGLVRSNNRSSDTPVHVSETCHYDLCNMVVDNSSLTMEELKKIILDLDK